MDCQREKVWSDHHAGGSPTYGAESAHKESFVCSNSSICSKTSVNSKASSYAGIYIHIPFCIKKCHYCDFYSTSDLYLKSVFITALLKEFQLRSNHSIIVDTVYIGGGTPSLLTIEELEKIMVAVEKNFTLIDSEELQITMEVNPGTITSGIITKSSNNIINNNYVKSIYIKEIRKFGINRLSIGVQSFQDEKLHFLNRIHSADTARQTIVSAKQAGFKNIGIDLIYGIPKETKEQWLHDIEVALEYCPEHLSCYMLSYEPDTPMFEAYKKGKIKPLRDERVSSLFRLTSNYLVSKYFSHYEISNFATSPENQSKHNKKYWEMVPYLGFGPSAHSYDGVCERSWNVKNVYKYVAMLEQGELPVEDMELLTNEQRVIEMIMVGLRTDQGIDIKSFERLYERLYSNKSEFSKAKFSKKFKVGGDTKCNGKFKVVFANVLEKIEKRQWGKINYEEFNNERFTLNSEGWLFLDTITQWFVDLINL